MGEVKECPYLEKSASRGGYGVVILRCRLTKQPCINPEEYEKCILYVRKNDEHKSKRK